MPEVLAVFQGIHQTLAAEEALKALGVDTRLVPTPPAVTRGCGFSILAAGGGDGVPSWWVQLARPGTLYRVVAGEGKRRYEEIDRR